MPKRVAEGVLRLLSRRRTIEPHVDARAAVTREITVEKSEFDDYFSVLEKASDRTRSVLYVFIIVYIAVLLYSLNAFAYPARQFN